MSTRPTRKTTSKTAPSGSAENSAFSTAALLDGELAHTVRESAHQIWLAGLGAFQRAQAEGSRAFDALVKEGSHLQQKTQAAAEERLNEVSGKMSSMASEMADKASRQWDRLEGIFEERVSRAMQRLGVPTRQEIDALQRRVDELSAALPKARTGARAAAAKTRSSPAAKRPAKKSAG